MAAMMVTAIARTIPTVAGFGFGAMYPSWRLVAVPGLGTGPSSDFRGINRWRCVSCFTLLKKRNVAIPALVAASHTTHDYATGAAAPGRVACLEKIDGPPRSLITQDRGVVAKRDAWW